MPTKEDLKYFQSMPLDIKVAMTKTRIREWVNHYGESGTYISFSGGKDSTVLLHLVRELYPDIPAVFVNTGLEYPEIQSFVKSFDNVVILRPKMSFSEVIRKYGYPFISKEVSCVVYDCKKAKMAGKPPPDYRIKRLTGTLTNKNGEKSRYCCEKYLPLLDVDFMVSSHCCDVMKKAPVHNYAKTSDRVTITGQMAAESALRKQQWLMNGCNAFESKNPVSNPMSFWLERDVLQYVYENNLPIASVYGDVVKDNDQLSFDDTDLNSCKFCTSKCQRTGCIFCGFGAHLDECSRFLLLKETHPKQYNYCIRGGEYDIDGLWKPNKDGLGMGHVFDVLNELYSKNGKPFIEY